MIGALVVAALLLVPLASAGSMSITRSGATASGSQSVSLSQSDVLLAIALGAGRQRDTAPLAGEVEGSATRAGHAGSTWSESMLPQSEMEQDILSGVHRTIAKYS